jgi:hypothetical protein
MSKYKDFIASCDGNSDVIRGITGGVRALLLSGITEFSLPKLVSFISNRKTILTNIEDVRDKLQKLS